MTTTRRDIAKDEAKLATDVPVLVFDSVGPAAAAYAGALVELESRLESFIQINKTGGASSGAIMAMLFSMEYTTREITQFVYKTDFATLLDGKGILDDFKRLVSMDGLYDSDELYTDLKNYVRDKTGNAMATFADFRKSGYKDLRVVATGLRRKEGKGFFDPFVFSYETARNTAVVDAVLASCAIPGIFPPVRLKDFGNGCYKQDPAGHLFVDGGLSSKILPITLYDEPEPLQNSILDDKPIPKCEPLEYTKILLEAIENEHQQKFIAPKANMRTRGFQVNSPEEIKQFQSGKITTRTCLFTHPLQAISDKANEYVFGPRTRNFLAVHGLERSYLIPRPADVSHLDFQVTTAQKDELFQAGQKTVADEYASKAVTQAGFFKPAKILKVQKEAQEKACVKCVIL